MADPTITVAAITGVTGLLGILASGRLPTRKEARTATRTLEARCRTLEDYSNTLRSALRTAGLDVPPYPDAMKEDE